MRLHIQLSKNTKPIPLNYQHLLTGVIHKWMGKDNEEHGKKSLYSFSWLQKTKPSIQKNTIDLSRDSYFIFSAYDSTLIKRITKGILDKPEAFFGSQVLDVQILNAPNFNNETSFFLNSPILIRTREGDNIKHITFQDPLFDTLLTENMKRKLQLAGLSYQGIEIGLDKSYRNPKTKLVDYKGIKNKTTYAPIYMKGTPEQLSFAWKVGLGESTGIGFGSVK